MAIHNQKKMPVGEKILRWIAFIIILIVVFAICTRMGDIGDHRDPFRGIDNPF